MSYSRVRIGLRTMAILGFLFCCHAVNAQSVDYDIDLDALSKSVDQLNQKLERLRGAVDQTRLDPEKWLEGLNYDADEVLAAVSEQITFQPYAGVLRGVTGTLRSRAGNSCDQSLLLAYLLKSAGYDARIAKGTLQDSDIDRLLDAIGSGRSAESLDYMLPAIEREFGSDAIQAQRNFDWADSKLASRADSAANFLLQTLAEAGIEMKPHDITAMLKSDTREYFWVQHRDGPADPWLDAHPAFGKSSPPTSIRAEEYFVDSIPEKYQHRLTLTAQLDQRFGDKSQTHSLMDPYSRPIANLDGVAISYRNHPNGLTAATTNDMSRAISDTVVLIPTLNNAMAPGAMAFDYKGRVVDPIVLSSGATALFATLADRMEQATSTVQNPDDPQDIVVLESMWLEFQFNSPNDTETRVRRYILPPRDSSQLTKEELHWNLITEHTYVVNSGNHPIEYLADRYLVTGIASGAWYTALAHKFTRPHAATPLPTTTVPQDFAPLSVYRFMDEYPGASAMTVFRQSANLVGIRRGFRNADIAFLGVDVIANGMVHSTNKDGKIWQDSESALRRGVWDTAVEAIPVQSISANIVRSSNAIDVLQSAIAQDIDLRVIKPQRLADLEQIDLPVEATVSMRDDLTNGYAIVVPTRLPEGSAMTAWWRINPETGESLGITADGYGQEIAEYLVDMALTYHTLVTAVKALEECTKIDDMAQGLCCLMEAHINNTAGLGFGGILGATTGAAGSFVFTVLDYETAQMTEQATGEAQGLMPTASANCHLLPATDW